MDKLEEVKRLLRKAIATNDSELIELANSLLEQETNLQPLESKVQNVDTKNDTDFLAPIITNDSIKTKKHGIPVNQTPTRFNSFQDDGTEAKDIVTPDIQPAERKRRPYEPIEHVNMVWMHI